MHALPKANIPSEVPKTECVNGLMSQLDGLSSEDCISAQERKFSPLSTKTSPIKKTSPTTKTSPKVSPTSKSKKLPVSPTSCKGALKRSLSVPSGSSIKRKSELSLEVSPTKSNPMRAGRFKRFLSAGDESPHKRRRSPIDSPSNSKQQSSSASEVLPTGQTIVKRPRGRPRKNPLPTVSQIKEETDTDDDLFTKVSRSNGQPNGPVHTDAKQKKSPLMNGARKNSLHTNDIVVKKEMMSPTKVLSPKHGKKLHWTQLRKLKKEQREHTMSSSSAAESSTDTEWFDEASSSCESPTKPKKKLHWTQIRKMQREEQLAAKSSLKSPSEPEPIWNVPPDILYNSSTSPIKSPTLKSPTKKLHWKTLEKLKRVEEVVNGQHNGEQTCTAEVNSEPPTPHERLDPSTPHERTEAPNPHERRRMNYLFPRLMGLSAPSEAVIMGESLGAEYNQVRDVFCDEAPNKDCFSKKLRQILTNVRKVSGIKSKKRSRSQSLESDEDVEDTADEPPLDSLPTNTMSQQADVVTSKTLEEEMEDHLVKTLQEQIEREKSLTLQYMNEMSSSWKMFLNEPS